MALSFARDVLESDFDFRSLSVAEAVLEDFTS